MWLVSVVSQMHMYPGMKNMARREWDAAVAAGRVRLGGDLWNTDNIWRKAFTSEPRAVAARYDYLSTGLWCDVTLSMPDGGRVERRIYG